MGMSKYVASTGIIGVLLSGLSLLRGSDEQQLTWRVALSWASWALTLALSIGMILDIRKASRGGTVEDDSPIAGKEYKYRASDAS
ncbi:hypothetical protein [Microbacterium halotolerans]|uniref:hypothetical protein n=1 Tax=Microbacterium halotolerans TaxID=246613 RepID=UPI001F092F5C|nr:hypothetical protein [Microbacterium halotolerans]